MDLHDWRVYRESIGLLTEVQDWSRRLPRGCGWLADQARRASGSVPLNIAEGLGRPSRPDRDRFFKIAIGSIYETGACLEVGFKLGFLPDLRFRKLWNDCDRLTRMLGKLIRSS